MTTWRVDHGDCLDLLRAMPDCSVDACVTDAPYGLSFMGKKWDYDVPSVEVWAECLRVLKPGGHLLAFAGTRTQHRMAVRIEDAGFEIRDMIAWVYGSGFPKSHNVACSIDKMHGHPNRGRAIPTASTYQACDVDRENKLTSNPVDPYEPKTDAARQWQGWGTALKPALEPITMARKPFPGTVAANVMQHGTGAVNVDGCRVGTDGGTTKGNPPKGASNGVYGHGINGACDIVPLNAGRWPANLIHDGSDEVLAGFPETKPSSASPRVRRAGGSELGQQSGWNNHNNIATQSEQYGDSGSAARFFYVAKASRQDRNTGLDSIEVVSVQCSSWENVDQKARLRVDTAQSPPKVIGVSGAPCNDATEWSTFLFGNGTTDRCYPVSRFTIETATSSTTESKTLSWLVRSNTSDSTAVALFATASGGSHAAGVEANTPCLTTTSEWTVSPRGVERAASPTRWTISGNAGQPSDHPTVKPTALMQYLCRLVTPPGGTVLDPFTGSGSTGKAAMLEGFNFIGFEREAEYVEIARRRIAEAAARPMLEGIK